MNYDWYKLFNEQEFLSTGLPSKEYSVFLEGRGQKNFMALKGINTCVQFDGEFFIVGLNGVNPQERSGLAVSKNSSGDIYVGFEIP